MNCEIIVFLLIIAWQDVIFQNEHILLIIRIFAILHLLHLLILLPHLEVAICNKYREKLDQEALFYILEPD